ncbi:MAG: pro-sigmaK processing inhibitor BofA family protein [Lachnospiraceae bacterium]|nr:pro-sigmaK processing inhibitor BofA family protein [Lachnospiraceae bacterium]
MTEITSGQGMLMIIMMCGVLLMIVLRGKRTDILIGFVLRALCGLVCIYVVNYVMLHFQYQGTIGVNQYTLLASGLLGLPGLIALYAIKIISLL